jgi:hypothetical protein
MKIFVLIILSVGLLFFLFQAGLKSIINSTVFINTITGKSTDSDIVKEEDFYGILNVDEPESATNAAALIVSGDATEYENVEYYINNVKVDSGKIKSNGTFSEEIGKLKSGENTIYIIAKSKNNKHETKSDVYSVTYLNEKPKLEIESPKDGDKVNKSEVQIKGKTGKEVTIRVNNQHVVIDVSGTFTTTFRLKEGDNKLEITATDIAGNVEKKEITVKYEKDE